MILYWVLILGAIYLAFYYTIESYKLFNDLFQRKDES